MKVRRASGQVAGIEGIKRGMGRKGGRTGILAQLSYTKASILHSQCLPQVAETEDKSHLSQGFLGFGQMKGFERQANPWQGAGTGHPYGNPELILCSLRVSHTRLARGPLVVGRGEPQSWPKSQRLRQLKQVGQPAGHESEESKMTGFRGRESLSWVLQWTK